MGDAEKGSFDKGKWWGGSSEWRVKETAREQGHLNMHNWSRFEQEIKRLHRMGKKVHVANRIMEEGFQFRVR